MVDFIGLVGDLYLHPGEVQQMVIFSGSGDCLSARYIIYHQYIYFTKRFGSVNLEIDQNFIAALLTLIGYSNNDTVVIFDRIREYLSHYTTKTKHEVINMAHQLNLDAGPSSLL